MNVPTGFMGAHGLPLKEIPPDPQFIDVCVASIINKPLGPTTVFLISYFEAISITLPSDGSPISNDPR